MVLTINYEVFMMISVPPIIQISVDMLFGKVKVMTSVWTTLKYADINSEY